MPVWRFLKNGSCVCLALLLGCLLALSTFAQPKNSVKSEFSSAIPVMHVGNTPPGPSPTFPSMDDAVEEMDVYGVVLEVQNVGPAFDQESKNGHPMPVPGDTLQKVTVRLDLDKPVPGLKGTVVTVDNVLGENPAYNIPLEPGARVLMNLERNRHTGQVNVYIANRDRTPALMILGSITILALLLIGGVEVSKHMLLAALILLGCYQLLFPAVLAGQGGLLATLLMCFCFTIFGSLIYRNPEQSQPDRIFTRTQSVVVLSTLAGLCVMAIIMRLMAWVTPLNGFTSEALAALWYRSTRMDYWALFMGTVLIGYQGFIFYLCWTLAQMRRKPGSEEEEELNFVERFKITMLRGRHQLGPLISSLGLLFLGLYLPILLQLQGTSTAQFINLESTASMLAVAFAGGLTLVLTVPMTALIAAWIYSLPAGKPAAVATDPAAN